MAQQYCIRGHDTHVVGRVQRMCRECRRMNDRARYQRRQEGQRAYARARYHRVGFLQRINRMADRAMQKMEALLGQW